MKIPSTQQRIENDSKLIAAASQCVALYQGLDQLEREVELSEGTNALFGPQVQNFRARIRQLAMTVRDTPAWTIHGLAAKAKLFGSFDDGSSLNLEVDDQPTDCGGMARSICSDIARLEHVPPPVGYRPKPQAEAS